MVKVPKSTKNTKVRRDRRTGEFVVAKQNIRPKRFTIKQIRDAVRKVRKDQATGAK